MKRTIAFLLTLALLLSVLPAAFAAETAALPMELADAVDGVSDYLTATRKEGSFSDWTILQLARSGNLTEELRMEYLAHMAQEIRENKGVMDEYNNTTYSRITLALSACGMDASNFAGYSMIAPLGDFDKITSQGINGTLYALLALDSAAYELPEGATASRERYVQALLEAELADGGWAFFGSVADVDMTAMVIQALAPYYAQAEVKAAVERGLTVLSGLQQADGGYESWGTACSESPAQVLLALCSLGIDPAKDSRFVKEDGAWLVSAIFSYLAKDTVAFGHADNTPNLLATQQVGYALAGYERLLEGKTSLFDMTDVKNSGVSYVYVGVYDYTASAAKAENASETGVVLADYPVAFTEGMTAAELVQKAFEANGIEAKGVAEGYIAEINGLGSCGGYSGWMLSYNNDDFSNWGLSSITPKSGDVLQFHYTMNLDTTTDDIGTGFYGLPVFTSFALGGVTKEMTRTTTFDESYNAVTTYMVDGEPAEGSGTKEDPFVLTFDLGYECKAEGCTYTTSLDPHYAIVTGLKDADFSKPVDCSISSLGGKSVAYFRISVKAYVKKGYVTVGVYDYTASAAKAKNASETGVVLADYSVPFYEGMTAAEAVQAAFDANGIEAKGVAEGYITEINGLGSCGGYSGWMLSYNNDDFSNWGLSSITPKNGDVLQFHYTMNLDTTTDDIGTGFYGLPVFTSFTLGGVTKEMTRTTTFDENYNAVTTYMVDGAPAEGSGTKENPFVLTFDLGYDGKAEGCTYTTSLDPHYAIVTGLKDADFSKPVDCSISTLGGKNVAYFRISLKAHDCTRYTDVDGHWARAEICEATEQGWMNGMSTTTFEPEGTMTRAMLVTILYRASGEKAEGKSSFVDVEKNIWYADAVAWAQQENIVNGVGGNRFVPDAPITREEFATILWRYAGEKDGAALPETFVDRASVSDWAQAAMNWAVAAGVINGTDGSRLDPQGTATRAQAAAMLCRYLAK
ncbi:MAG: S-layer homology domain-containing protein [Faecousia sp.]